MGPSDDGGITETIGRLHVHAGVRRDSLGEVLVAEVRAAWHIAPQDTVETVRAKVIGQVRRVLDTLSPKARLVGEVLLNMSYDLRLCADGYDERRVKLADLTRARGYSPSASYRTLQKEVQPALRRVVHGGAEPLSPADIDHIIVAERKHLARLPAAWPPRDNCPSNEQLERFIANDLYLSRPDEPGALPALDVPGHGKWIKVFTSINKLATDMGADTGEWLSLSARDLIENVYATGEPVGLLVDPHLGEVMYLTPDIVRELAEREH
ncbi:hypothetical protein [Actinocrispum wychmicini]|uniref:Uncharacterized protein n=1 Tax=Actinocrispum wychmicini TaxID=1213861 RepID=A0A4R2IYH9_9PSEU|nr:hypothetical protein [Actinocrispum wychmicini]TCO47975.1 hypothetical protein EV192_11627 [Actinocrispum wychmicini]